MYHAVNVFCYPSSQEYHPKGSTNKRFRLKSSIIFAYEKQGLPVNHKFQPQLVGTNIMALLGEMFKFPFVFGRLFAFAFFHCGFSNLRFSFCFFAPTKVASCASLTEPTWCMWCGNFSPKSYGKLSCRKPHLKNGRRKPLRIEWEISMVIVKFGSYCCWLISW